MSFIDTNAVAPHLLGCDCSACTAGLARLDVNVDGQGGTIDGKPVWTAEQVQAHLNRTAYPGTGIPGAGWSNDGVDARPASGDPVLLRFGFHTQLTMDASAYASTGMAEYAGFQAFSAAQAGAARKAIALWNDLVAIDIVETSADQADITFGNYDNQPRTQAYAYLPYNYSPPETEFAGDVWINGVEGSNLELDNGYYGLHTLVHEIGHALGLMHPGDYNAAPGVSITYPNSAEYYQDSRQYTVMSYFNAEFTGGGHVDWSRLDWVYGQTPLLHDILAIQAIYGADPTTRAGATVYGFNSNAGRDVFDFTLNVLPVISIYDAGGIDTLDFSGWATDSTIDLNPGGFSSGGGSGVVPLQVLKNAGLLPSDYTQAEYDALRAAYNALDGLLHDNISIAYGTIIENAIGGSGDDTIIGNGVGNILVGGGGNDTISGGGSSDWLSGGDGEDLLDGGSDHDFLHGGSGNDTLIGAGGLDTLDGGSGADTMRGGPSRDTYIVDNPGDVVIESENEGRDKIESAISYALPANVEQLNLIGTAHTSGFGTHSANKLFGNSGKNILYGQGGDDLLSGGSNGDRLYGGNGNDILIGGQGGDRFHFNAELGPRNVDQILDFSPARDTINLARYIFKQAGSGTLDPDAFRLGSEALSAGDRILYDRATGEIFYDPDGIGGASAILFATVTPGTPLTNADFFLYG